MSSLFLIPNTAPPQIDYCNGCDADLSRVRCHCNDEALCDDCNCYHRPSEDCAEAAREALPRAGARLDKARFAFNALCAVPGKIDEAEFARWEARLKTADTAYRALIELATGEAAGTVALRLAA